MECVLVHPLFVALAAALGSPPQRFPLFLPKHTATATLSPFHGSSCSHFSPRYPGPKKANSYRPQRSKSRFWRRLLVAAVSIPVLVVLGAAFLFSGSEVICAELVDDGPRLRCAFDVAAPPEALWEAFTRTDEPRPYYFDAVLQAEMRTGGRWRFVTDDRERLLAGGEILTLEPPRRFEHTFRAADLDDPASRVLVEITEAAGGSRVTLVHDGFPEKTTTYRRFRRAHPLALSALKAFLERGELPIRARIYTAIFKPGMKTFTVRAEPWE